MNSRLTRLRRRPAGAARRMRMANLPAAVGHLHQYECFETFRVKVTIAHPGLDRVPGRGIRRLSAGMHRHLIVGVRELQVRERLELGAEMTVTIIHPAIVDTG